MSRPCEKDGNKEDDSDMKMTHSDEQKQMEDDILREGKQ